MFNPRRAQADKKQEVQPNFLRFARYDILDIDEESQSWHATDPNSVNISITTKRTLVRLNTCFEKVNDNWKFTLLLVSGMSWSNVLFSSISIIHRFSPWPRKSLGLASTLISLQITFHYSIFACLSSFVSFFIMLSAASMDGCSQIQITWSRTFWKHPSHSGMFFNYYYSVCHYDWYLMEFN